MGRATPASAAALASGDDLKTWWPEVVGWETLNASIKINSDRPDVSTPFYMVGTALPPDYDPNRVIIIFDAGNVVVRTPVVG
ncbi:hypothetical protein ACP70R_029511 [Stipagrostis hirtigluma subsp. patula]